MNVRNNYGLSRLHTVQEAQLSQRDRTTAALTAIKVQLKSLLLKFQYNVKH